MNKNDGSQSLKNNNFIYNNYVLIIIITKICILIEKLCPIIKDFYFRIL